MLMPRDTSTWAGSLPEPSVIFLSPREKTGSGFIMCLLLLAIYTHTLSQMTRDPILTPSAHKRVGTRGKVRAVHRQTAREKWGENNFFWLMRSHSLQLAWLCEHSKIKCSQARCITPRNRCFYSLNPHLSPTHSLWTLTSKSRWQVLQCYCSPRVCITLSHISY